MIQNNYFAVRNPRLSSYIQHYFVLDFSNMPDGISGVKVPPMGFPVLQFHFGETANFYRHKNLNSRSIFIGQLSRHVMLYPTKGVKLLGVNFKPYGLYNLFGISPREIQNSGMESHTILGEENIQALIEAIKQKGIETGIDEVEKLLLRHENQSILKQKYFDSIVDKMEQENGLINYDDLLDSTISKRTLQRYFQEIIGISPKLYSQVLRHKYIMEQLYKNPEMKWSDILLNGFYYDFAHFTKDFTQFSGLTPKQYLPIKNCFASALLMR